MKDKYSSKKRVTSFGQKRMSYNFLSRNHFVSIGDHAKLPISFPPHFKEINSKGTILRRPALIAERGKRLSPVAFGGERKVS